MGKQDILKKIKNMRNEFEILDYLKEEVPEEFLLEEDFIEELTKINPRAEEAISMFWDEKTIEKMDSEIAQKSLKIFIEEDPNNLEIIPKKRRKELYELAQEYEKNEQYEDAKKVYSQIVKYGKDEINKFNARYGREEEDRQTIYYHSKFSYYMCKIKNGEELSKEDLEEIEKLVAEDKENILGLRNPGKISPFDFFSKFFEELSLEQLETEILPSIGTGKKHREGEHNGHSSSQYPEGLSPEKRLRFIDEKYKITKVKLGREKLTGFVIIETEKNPDVVIVEKFFSVGRDGVAVEPSQKASTYFVHKDADIDLTKATLGELSERKESQKQGETKLIDRIYHRGEKTYYERFDKKYGSIQRKEDTYQIDGESFSIDELEELISICEEDCKRLQQKIESKEQEIAEARQKIVETEEENDQDIESIENDEMEKQVEEAIDKRIGNVQFYKELIAVTEEEIEETRELERTVYQELVKYKQKLTKELSRGE